MTIIAPVYAGLFLWKNSKEFYELSCELLVLHDGFCNAFGSSVRGEREREIMVCVVRAAQVGK